MSHYEHITTLEREKIDESLCLRKSLRSIARDLGRAPSTISRERKRNQISAGHYSGILATLCYRKRRQHCRRHKRLEDSVLKQTVEMLLFLRLSPEQIEHRMQYEKSEKQISAPTIYRGIKTGDLDGEMLEGKAVKFLRHHGKKRHGKGEIENRGKFKIDHTIHERPQEANDREVAGHWEGDTILGKNGSACVVTLVDRRLRYTKTRKVSGRCAEPVRKKMIAMLARLPEERRRSVTLDRGKEFAQHARISKALGKMPIYFCDPHSPWQRGTNENTNGLLRQFLPKGFDIAACSDSDLQLYTLMLNIRPRKCLGWVTPYEAYFGKVLHLI